MIISEARARDLVGSSGKTTRELETASGVSRSSISAWLNGTGLDSPDRICAVLRAAGYRAESLGLQFQIRKESK